MGAWAHPDDDTSIIGPCGVWRERYGIRRRAGRVERDLGRDERDDDPPRRRGGGFGLEVKIPMAVLPAAVDPANMGLTITPYDHDDNAAEGTTTLRHDDQRQTRVAWSAFGSVPSNPYRWGHARLAGAVQALDVRVRGRD